APDNMDVVYDDQINAKFNGAGYPTGMINRINGTTGSRSGWKALVDAVLADDAKCGLAINSTKSGNDLSVTVKLGIAGADMPAGNYFMTVLLIEKEMSGTGPGWDQRNYYSEFGSAAGGPSHYYYNFPDPIVGYVHKNVVRAVLQNAQLGDKIDAAALKAGTTTEFNYSWDLQGLDNDLQIVAFISEFTDNPAVTGIESSFIYNAQIADVGTSKDFD
ncbi:Omp28-related outer membrane protein, partial [bacterium]|nr:Omp28-related outer membrane protein [bacterium]